MISRVIIGGGIFAWIILIIQAVAVSTRNWFIATMSDKTTIDVGLFAVCVPDKYCTSYQKYMFNDAGPTFSYIAVVGLQLLGCCFNFVSLIICITHAAAPNSNPERSSIKRTSGLWLLSGGFILAGVIWMYISLANIDSYAAVSSVVPGYSFYLGCFTGTVHVIAAIGMGVIASRLPVIATSAVSSGTPQTLVMQADASGYPSADSTDFSDVDHMEHVKSDSTGYPVNASYGLPQQHPSYGYDQP